MRPASAPPSHLPRRLRDVVSAYQTHFSHEVLSQTVDAGDFTPLELRNYLSKSPVPTRVRGALRGTPLDGFTFERLKELAGDQLLNPAHKALLVTHASVLGELPPLRLRDYLDMEVLTPNRARQEAYQKYRNLRIPESFRRAIGLFTPPFLPESDLRPPSIWISKAGHHTNLHTDSDDNFVVVAIGVKRFHLFPPTELGRLHLAGVWNSSYLKSTFDPRHPDEERFPGASEIRHTVLDITAGDAFFLPLGWAHFVECSENAFMYNYWLKSDAVPLYRRAPIL